MMRQLLLAASLLGLSGCITAYPDITQSRSPCRTDPGGWCDFVREAAAESYAYAILSANAYKDEDEYRPLPAAFSERDNVDNDDSGFAYAKFDRFAVDASGQRGKLLARVIAFRGTDFGSTSDIFSGSLGDSQIERARAVISAERADLGTAGQTDVAIEVTGHSLGAALATQISIENPDITAFLFNPSPLFDGDADINDANRISVSERGEFLRVLRRYKTPFAANMTLVNCSPSASAGKKHSIRGLADCLTWIAAYDDAQALKLIDPNNITKPEVECGPPDKKHPGTQDRRSENIVLCAHAPVSVKLDKDEKSDG